VKILCVQLPWPLLVGVGKVRCGTEAKDFLVILEKGGQGVSRVGVFFHSITCNKKGI